jgi:hypothetical protein
LHQPVEKEQRAGERSVTQVGTLLQRRRIRHEDADGRAAFFGEESRLLDQVRGEVERRQVAVADGPEPKRAAAGAAAGFEQGSAFSGKNRSISRRSDSHSPRNARPARSGRQPPDR